MSLGDFLKGLFKDNKLVFSPKIHFSINIGSGNNNGNKVLYDQRKQLITIDPSLLTEEEKGRLQKSLKPELTQEKPILDRVYKTTAEDYKQKIGLPENQDLLTFFSDKLPVEDLNILRAALYIRTVFKVHHGDVTQLKTQLIGRYGIRARSITNLCSAGYFESWIRPLYEEMSKKPGFRKEKFLEIYDEIVLYSPFAYFVNRSTPDSDVIQHILGKIEQMKRYGIKTLNIHGIGHANVAKVKIALEAVEKEVKCTKSILEEDNIIVVKLHFE
ncbi:hypothetical protein A2Z00_05715 [Candidatus Gottesmanbacteria bacterium RBG_13_45_10]|uniref:Uncharacterized protein n=1 Tax=Candidatus Gottesmanbacteria bacterium RBG_13_45_10 TaxID=1798370 RepID=A0A1F5ZG20_9BACT|nr:MAG: hypothetical protein A2Z00_05715 [Candidatus Gottesmanbacteria bacterium RBG_13_45_10]